MSRHRVHFLRLLIHGAALPTTLFAWFLQNSASCLFASDSTDPSSEYFAVTSFFREYDRNQDGELTQDELPGETFDFDAIDRDGNGKVDGIEGFAYVSNLNSTNPPKKGEGQSLPPNGTTEKLSNLESETKINLPWPGLRGPDGSGLVSKGPALARTWAPDGPEVCWRVPVAGGFGGAAISHGRVFILDRTATDEENLRCFDFLKGKELWKHRYPTENVRLPYSGSRTVPSVEGHLVWTIGAVGDLRCFNWQKQELLWRTNLLTEKEIRIPPQWGVSQSPLLVGDLVVAPLFDNQSSRLCGFDKKTGERRWVSENLGVESYVTPSLHRIEGSDQIMTFGMLAIDRCAWHGIRPSDGEIVWSWPNFWNPAQIAAPVPLGQNRFWITGGYDLGSRIIEVERSTDLEWSVREVGKHESAGSQVHTPILFQEHLYANLNHNENKIRSRRNEGGLGCFDLAGNLLWNTGEDPNFDRGGFIFADGLLFSLDGRTGDFVLIDPSPQGYRELDRAKPFSGRGGQIWAPLAIADGRILIRSQEELVCLDVRVK